MDCGRVQEQEQFHQQAYPSLGHSLRAMPGLHALAQGSPERLDLRVPGLLFPAQRGEDVIAGVAQPLTAPPWRLSFASNCSFGMTSCTTPRAADVPLETPR